MALPPLTSLEVPVPGSSRLAASKSERLLSTSIAYQYDLCPDNGSCHEWDQTPDQSTSRLAPTQENDDGPEPAPTKWFCCQCMETFQNGFLAKLMVKLGNDGPKNTKTEIKCVTPDCEHVMCDNCPKAA